MALLEGFLPGRRKAPPRKLAGSIGRAAYRLGAWAGRQDWRSAPGAAARWARTRPYGLVLWIALIAAAGLWPRGRPANAPQPGEKAVAGASDPRRMSPDAFEAEQPGRGRVAIRPRQIPVLGWRDILWRTARETLQDKIPSEAGGVTFYALLAIFPAIGAFVSLYGLFADVGTVREQLDDMRYVFPASVISIVGDQMLRLATAHEAKLSTAFVISLLLSVWSASAGMRALFEGLNVAYDEAEKRPYWKLILLTYGAAFGAVLFLTLAAGLLVALPVAFDFLGLGAVMAWWTPIRWLVMLAVATLAFSLLYRFGPSRARPRWRWVTWGAVVAAVLWLAGSLAFSTYVSVMAPYDATYGPLGAVIGFMVWIWFSTMTVLVGAELNAEIEHQTARDSTTGPEMPMGQRGAAMADTVGLRLDLSEEIAGGIGAVKGLIRQVTGRR
ncbi:MAG TPA: YihY/virulence factor BrkB family protein [Caulobacter sp.]|nr:YihY/virulence factor BrkB family protein [Caulobacter sp.]